MGEQTIYLAGPVQHADDHGMGWRAEVRDRYDDIDFHDPTDAYDPQKTYSEIVTDWGPEEIVRTDLELLRQSDAVLAHWEEVPTCGTPMEIMYATERYDVPVVVQTHVDEPSIWLRVHSDSIVDTFDEAIEALRDRIHTYTMTREKSLWKYHQEHV